MHAALAQLLPVPDHLLALPSPVPALVAAAAWEVRALAHVALRLHLPVALGTTGQQARQSPRPLPVQQQAAALLWAACGHKCRAVAVLPLALCLQRLQWRLRLLRLHPLHRTPLRHRPLHPPLLPLAVRLYPPVVWLA